jgi:DNA-binding SARP family transcriptional activator
MLTPDLLDEDLLPEWDEDWLRKGQEVFRERRLRALEAMTARLSDAGRHWQAVEAGLEAAVAEPLRESAQRALVKAYLADGNWGEALRQYRSFRDLLVAELGVEPSPEFLELITPLRSATGLAIVGQQAR